MWFRNCYPLRLVQPRHINAETVAEALGRLPIGDCPDNTPRTVGWAPALPSGQDLVHATDGRLLVCLETRRRLLPPAVIRQVVAERIRDLEQREGRPARAAERRDINAQVVAQLLPRSFQVANQVRVIIDTVAGWLLVDTASATVAKSVAQVLGTCLGGLPTRRPRLRGDLGTALTGWLRNDGEGWPGGPWGPGERVEFSAGGARAKITGTEILGEATRVHLEEGLQVARLAVTWRDRIDLQIGADGVLRALRWTDTARELDGEQQTQLQVEDAEATLVGGDLRALVADLVAITGELPEDAPADPDQPDLLWTPEPGDSAGSAGAPPAPAPAATVAEAPAAWRPAEGDRVRVRRDARQGQDGPGDLEVRIAQGAEGVICGVTPEGVISVKLDHRESCLVLLQDDLEPAVVDGVNLNDLDWLTHSTATDVNFRSHLDKADAPTLRAAIAKLEGQHGKKTALTKLTARLRKLEKAGGTPPPQSPPPTSTPTPAAAQAKAALSVGQRVVLNTRGRYAPGSGPDKLHGRGAVVTHLCGPPFDDEYLYVLPDRGSRQRSAPVEVMVRVDCCELVPPDTGPDTNADPSPDGSSTPSAGGAQSPPPTPTPTAAQARAAFCGLIGMPLKAGQQTTIGRALIRACESDPELRDLLDSAIAWLARHRRPPRQPAMAVH